MYTLEQQLLSTGHLVRPSGSYRKMSLTIHSTGNPCSTARNERDWLDNPHNTRQASWHYVVGDGVVIQAIPDQEEAWHCGEETGNRHSISVEIIESSDRRRVLETAAAFVADKLREYSLTTAVLYRHCDWAAKNCPRILIDPAYVKGGLDWAWFVNRVQECMEEGEPMEERYQTIDQVPEWGKGTVRKLTEKGIFADPKLLNLTEDMLRLLVFHDRLGIYG